MRGVLRTSQRVRELKLESGGDSGRKWDGGGGQRTKEELDSFCVKEEPVRGFCAGEEHESN